MCCISLFQEGTMAAEKINYEALVRALNCRVGDLE